MCLFACLQCMQALKPLYHRQDLQSRLSKRGEQRWFCLRAAKMYLPPLFHADDRVSENCFLPFQAHHTFASWLGTPISLAPSQTWSIRSPKKIVGMDTHLEDPCTFPNPRYRESRNPSSSSLLFSFSLYLSLLPSILFCAYIHFFPKGYLHAPLPLGFAFCG